MVSRASATITPMPVITTLYFSFLVETWIVTSVKKNHSLVTGGQKVANAFTHFKHEFHRFRSPPVSAPEKSMTQIVRVKLFVLCAPVYTDMM
jgi:hypothetical protein